MSGLLTASHVGELLHLDRSTVYRMAADGRLRAVKVGRQWRFRGDDVERLLDGTTTGSLNRWGADDALSSPPRSPIPADVATAVIQVAATSLGVMMVVTDMDGRPITPIVNACPAFEAQAASPLAVRTCTEEWRVLAEDPDLRPRFRAGALGFECARAFVPSGRELVGMVLAGGIAPEGQAPDGLYVLDATARARVIDALPTLAAMFGRLCPRTAATSNA